MEDNPSVLKVTRFSNEVHLRLDSCINKQNVQFWVPWNPRLTVANPLHPRERDTVWFALSNVAIIGPVFTDGTVTSSVYCRKLT
jgi:hypothetical protein